MAEVAPTPIHDTQPPTEAMRHLFPSSARTAFCDATHEPAPLFDAEAANVVHAVASRQREFAFGRSCARAALAQLGAASAAIPAAADRSPVWPRGFVGSITHCAGFVGAVVAPSDQLEAIGFDVELAVPLDADLVRLVCTAAEIDWMRNAPPIAPADWGKVLFSAKEALHKCIAPRSGVMLDFRDVEVTPRPSESAFSARLLATGYQTVPDFTRIVGRFAVTQAFVATTAVIHRSDSGATQR